MKNEHVSGRGSRNVALDYTKGMLVVCMILYHWLNYFVSAPAELYRYLRFITPSFIFISGFIIGHVYLSKYECSDYRMHARLLQRGFRLLLLFTALNVIGILLLNDPKITLESYLQNALAIYVTGARNEAFFWILVPIGYVFIVSPILLYPCRWYARFLELVCIALTIAVIALDYSGNLSSNLGLITFGLLGIMIGRLPIERINELAKYTLIVALCYGCYLVAISIWGATLSLQIVGVCISLLFLYVLATRVREDSPLARRVVLLGKYSLVGYICHIGLLQILKRTAAYNGRVVVSLALTIVCTWLIVEALDRLRSQFAWTDKAYKAVFG